MKTTVFFSKVSLLGFISILFVGVIVSAQQNCQFLPPIRTDSLTDLSIVSPVDNDVISFKTSRDINLKYTFASRPEFMIYLLDVYLLDVNKTTVLTLASNANTDAGSHEVTRNVNECLPSGNYFVRFNETYNTGSFWSTSYNLKDIPVKVTDAVIS